MAGTGSALGFAVLLALLMVALNQVLPGVWKALTVLLGLAGGSLAYFLVCGLPPAPDFTPAAGSFFIPAFDFQPGAILAFIFCFIAVSVNQLGSTESIGFMLKAPALPRRNQRGQTLAGLLNVGAGALGVIGPVSYSLSAGIITPAAALRVLPLSLRAWV